MINRGATHVGVATDHVIESFRNRLWPGYKTGAGIDPDLLSQFGLLEEALAALGVAVWPMVEFEADDALAAAARIAASDPAVERVLICTPDKDLAQCVRGTRVVQWIAGTNTIVDEAGVVAKFGVPPASIPDYLALVGDAADGYPGPAGMGREVGGGGARASSATSRRSPTTGEWRVNAANSGALARTLARERELGLALPRARDAARPICRCSTRSTTLRWTGPTPAFEELARRFDAAVVGQEKRGRASHPGSPG